MGKSGMSGVRLAQCSGAAVGPMAGVGYTRSSLAEAEYSSAGLFWAERSKETGAGHRFREETEILMSRTHPQMRSA